MSDSLQKSRLRLKSFLKGTAFVPVSFAWEWVYRIRRSFYEYGVFKKVTFKVPVISV